MSQSGLRQRDVSSGSPPVDSVQGLSAALRRAKEAASDNGLSQDELSCSLAKTKLKLPPTSLKSTKSKPCLSKCLKIVWNMWVVFTILLGLVVLYLLYGPKGKVNYEFIHHHNNFSL